MIRMTLSEKVITQTVDPDYHHDHNLDPIDHDFHDYHTIDPSNYENYNNDHPRC